MLSDWWARQNSNLRPLPCQGSGGLQKALIISAFSASHSKNKGLIPIRSGWNWPGSGSGSEWLGGGV